MKKPTSDIPLTAPSCGWIGWIFGFFLKFLDLVIQQGGSHTNPIDERESEPFWACEKVSHEAKNDVIFFYYTPAF